MCCVFPLTVYTLESFWMTVESLFWSWLGPGESDLHVEGSSSRSILIKVLVGFYQVQGTIIPEEEERKWHTERAKSMLCCFTNANFTFQMT